MRIERYQSSTSIRLVLSERNLRTLLAKLQGSPPDSLCTISMVDDVGTLFVSAEPDDVHYLGRTPGRMHPATEATLAD